jgi:hypothetical protein
MGMFQVGLQEVLIIVIGLPVLFVSMFGIAFLGLVAFGEMRPVLREGTERSRLPSAESAPEIAGGPNRTVSKAALVP